MTVSTRFSSLRLLWTLGLLLIAASWAGAAFPATAHAKSVYVSAFGSDTGCDGLSADTAFATVQHAVDVAASGDIVQVGDGTFTGGITMKNGVSLLGAGPSKTTLVGPSTTIMAVSVGTGTSISGFTISGNSSGIYCFSSSPTIMNNTITGNGGHGIYGTASSSPTIMNNTIAGNGIYGIYCSSASPSIMNNTISENTNGGIYCTSASSSPSIINNTITGNTDYGIFCPTSRSITGNTVTGTQGVGIASSSSGVTSNTISGNSVGIDCSTSNITGNIITGNSTGIWCSGSASITNNTLSGNYTGIHCDKPTYLPASPSITNNTITSPSNGTGIFREDGSPTITNNTIVGSGNSGYGIFCMSIGPGVATITNCIVWGHGCDLYNCPSARYSDVGSIYVGDDPLGFGSIKAAPSFVNTATGDYRLRSDSPCIDKGTSMAAPTTDKDGAPRPCGDGYDIGAYEYHAATYQLHYKAGVGGTLSGTTSQTVDYQGSGSAVTAGPATGSHFVVWSDGKTENPRTDSNLTADATYTATFAINQYQLRYTAGAGGGVSGTTAQTVYHSDNGSLVRADAAIGYHFVSWSDGVTTPYRTDANVTADVTYDASFAINSYQLHYQTADADGSIVGSATQVVDYDHDGSSVTAVPTIGQHFVSWSDGVTTPYRTDANVTADATYTASFAVNTPHQLHYVVGANGTLSGSTSQTVDYDGSGTSVNAWPEVGYHFASWSDGSTANPRSDVNVTADATYTAAFSIDTHTLTYSAGNGGSIAGSDTQVLGYGFPGDAVTAIPATGYHFVGWSDGVTANPRIDTSVTADKSVAAEFALTTYTLGTATRLSGPSSVKAKKSLKLTGTVTPGGPGAVTITMTRKVGRKWKSAGHAHVNVVGGRYAYTPKPKYKGSWRFVASYSGGVSGVNTYLGSKSVAKTVKVK